MSNYLSAAFYSFVSYVRRLAQNEASKTVAENFGFNPLELSVQSTFLAPVTTNGYHGHSNTAHSIGLMHAYYPRDGERNGNPHYEGPRPDKKRLSHRHEIKARKAPVWITNTHKRKSGKGTTYSNRLLYFRRPSEVLR